MFKKFIKILKSKKKFTYPPNTKILILDEIFFNLIKKIIPDEKISCLIIRLQEINFFVLFKLLLSNEKLKFFNYVKKYIQLSKCKIVITGNDNLVLFYKLKKYFPEKKFISIQNGFRNPLFFKELKKNKSLKADFIFTFNKSYCELFKKNISTKTIKLGSFRNNFFKKTKKRRNSILYISMGFPDEEENYGYCNSAITFKKKDFYKADEILLQNIFNYCQLNKIKLEFLPKFSSERGNQEIDYFKKFVNFEKIKLHKKNTLPFDNKLIYKISDQCLATICTHSTFAFESLARGNRTAIFNNKISSSKKIMNIMWNYQIKNKGKFWTNNVNKNEVTRILDFIIYSSNKEWKLSSENISNELMAYDQNNKSFVNVLRKLFEGGR